MCGKNILLRLKSKLFCNRLINSIESKSKSSKSYYLSNFNNICSCTINVVWVLTVCRRKRYGQILFGFDHCHGHILKSELSVMLPINWLCQSDICLVHLTQLKMLVRFDPVMMLRDMKTFAFDVELWRFFHWQGRIGNNTNRLWW